MKFLILFVLLTTSAFAQVLDDTAVNLQFSGRVNMAKANSFDTRATVYLGSANGNLVHIVGSTTITSFGPAAQTGIQRNVIFDGVTALTYNASTLVIPGSTTMTTAAGDSALIVSDSTTKWIVIQYTRKATAP